MQLQSTLSQALRALARNKLRSGLSMLGVSIGAAAVICTIAIGNGGAMMLQKQLQSLGDNLVWVEAGGRTRDGVRLGNHKTKTLLHTDAEAIVKEVAEIKSVSPQADGRAQVIFGSINWNTSIKGISPEYFFIRHWTLASGRLFRADEVEQAENVCLLGQTVAQILFGNVSPEGERIRVNHLSCLVIGTLSSKGQSATGQDQDDQVFMPFRTVQRKISGVTWLDDIQCSALSPELVPIAAEKVTQLLRQRHHIPPDEEPDFNIRHPEDLINAQLEAGRVFARWMACVAAISLIVGGIGIMNIMLVAVTERTKEIGLRLAIGARDRHIRMQFLAEALLLSVIGGCAGIVFGILGADILGELKDLPMQISFGPIALAGLFAILVGFVFGYYPAHRAAQLDPIEALRQE